MGTQEQQSIEELGAEVSSSVLTPLRFLERSARVWEDRPAVVDGERTWTYAEHDERVRRAAAAVRDELGIGAGRPRRGAAAERRARCSSCTTPCRASAACSSRSTPASPDPSTTTSSSTAARRCSSPTASSTSSTSSATRARVVWARRVRGAARGRRARSTLERPEDERALLSINYTSGTTGRPKGVMTNHRGAYLHASA